MIVRRYCVRCKKRIRQIRSEKSNPNFCGHGCEYNFMHEMNLAIKRCESELKKLKEYKRSNMA